MTFDAAVLLPGKDTTGKAMALTAPISFWGGVNPESALVADPRHPQYGRCITGSVLLVPATIGSSSAAAILLAMGREPICTCGYVKLWHGTVMSSENSQHITDWYTPSHIIHGFIFYGLFWLVGRRWPLGLRLCLAILIEGAWEITENSDFIINRYREATVSLDYYGDSVVNSVADIACFVVGYAAAATVPVWSSVAGFAVTELLLLVWIRDSLLLNMLMLVHPVDAVKAWQLGG